MTTSLIGRTKSLAHARPAALMSTSLPSETTGTTPESRLLELLEMPSKKFSTGLTLAMALSTALTMLAPSCRMETCRSWMPTSRLPAPSTTRGPPSWTTASLPPAPTSHTRAGAPRIPTPTEPPLTDLIATSSPRTTTSADCLLSTSPIHPLVRDLVLASLSVSVTIAPSTLALTSSVCTQPSTSRPSTLNSPLTTHHLPIH